MSVVPAEIAGLGSTQQLVRVRPSFEPLKAPIAPQEYFVLSRIDGKQSLREVLLATGLPVERAIAIVQRLRSLGALLLPGETDAPRAAGATEPTPPAPRAPVPAAVPASRTISRPISLPTGSGPVAAAPQPIAASRTTTSGPVARPDAAGEPIRRAVENPPAAGESGDPGTTHDLSLPGATASELAALREDAALADRVRRLILAMARLADGRDPWALLGVPVGSDARILKRAYFRLSKDIHPDRYFGKRLGSFAERLTLVFEATSRAYARLTSPERGQAPAIEAAEQPQTPQEYAAELFVRACQIEIDGDPLEAMKLFAAAVRVDAQPRYLRRAASCALAAGQPRSAVEYAKKAYSLAPGDPSLARLLASAFRAAGKLAAAEELLVVAVAFPTENDALSAELAHDLAEVRRLLAQS